MKPRLIALLLTPLAALHSAELRLPSIFSDHLVLQCDKAVPVWGWADAGEEVSVSIAGQKKAVQAGADGACSLKLDPLPASSQAQTLVIGEHTIADVLVG